MNSRFLVFLLLPLMLLATVFPIPNIIPKAHAATPGIVCIAETTATKCPPLPSPVFTGPVTTPPTQLRVAVFINSSAPMNGFDITLKADRTILKPHDAELAGSVLPAATSTVLVKCIGGVLKAGSTCQPTDTIDTIRFAVVGPGGFLTPVPTTGLLFTAVYNITGTTATGGITIGYQTGCSTATTSVPPDTCISISDGTITPVPETSQNGGFNNNTPPPSITLSASPASIGPIRPNTAGTSTITVTANNGFADFVSLTTAQTTGLTANPSPPVVDLTTTPSATSTLTVSAATVANYTVTVFGTYTVTDTLTGVASTLSATSTLRVQVANFIMTLNPASIGSAQPGTSVTSTITITPVSTFTGTVTLSTPSVSPGLTTGINPASVPGASGTATLTVSLASTLGRGTYNVTVRGSATGQTTNFIFRITVSVVHDVAINSFTTSATQGTVGVQITFTILVQNKGTVQETVTVNALAGTVTVATKNATIAAGASQNVTLTWNTAGYAPGTYQLGAQVMQVSGETSTLDNTLTSGTLSLSAAPSGGLGTTQLAIIAIVAILAVIGAILLLRRRRRPQTQ